MKPINNWKKTLPSDYITSPISFLQREIDRVASDFYDFFGNPLSYSQNIEKLVLNPLVDIVEDDKNFKVEAEMPGMGEEDIKITIKDNVLFIKGKKELSKKNEGKNYNSREICYGSYEKKIHLPDYIETDKAEASFKKGMLWISFPKKIGKEKNYHEVKIQRKLDNKN